MKKTLRIIFVILFLLLVIFLIYFEYYYHADKSVNQYLTSTEIVKISNTNQYIFFDGPGKDNVIIFYPGANVESKAYSRLMYKLAEKGIDCFLLDFPFRFAFFGYNYPDSILKNYKYNDIYLMGHSLGGVVASIYAKNNGNISGIIFLASYPDVDLDNNLKTISIYGKNDKVLNIANYNKANWPSNFKEYIIDGNHAGFGEYGKQRKDGNGIGSHLQQDKVVEILLNEL